MRKKLKYFLLHTNVSFFLFFIGFLILKPIIASEILFPTRTFPIGEKIEFVIKWGMFSVGQATLHVKKVVIVHQKKVIHIVAKAKTNSFLSKLYPVRDKIHTWVDYDTLLPIRYRKTLREGGYFADEEMIYDQQHHRAIFKSIKNNTKKEMSIPSYCQDALSSLFYFRCLKIRVNEKYEIDVNSDEKNWKLNVNVIKNTKLKTKPFSEVNAIEVEPQAKYQGIFVRRGKMNVWLMENAAHIPLKMKTKVPFGSVSAIIVNYQIVKGDSLIEDGS